MLSIWRFINRPLQKTLQSVEDPIRQALITVFYYVFLLNFVKIAAILLGAIYHHQINKIVACFLATVFTILVIKTLLIKVKHLKLLIHIGIFSGVLFLYSSTIFFKSNIALLNIQSVFMICMWSFYALKGKWGFVYSTLATIPLFYEFIVEGVAPIPLDIGQTIFIVFMTLLNFSIIFMAHYYYTNILYRTITAKNKLFEELAEVNRNKALFFSSMSHEFRTPLNSVIGMTNILLHGNENKEQKENLDILKFSAENLLVLINDILDINKIDSGNVQLEAISFNLNNLVKNAWGGLIIKANEKGLQLKLTLDPLLEHKNVIGDPTRLLQIILNLVINAIKFTNEGEVALTIAIIENGDEMVTLHFSVKDTGMGLSEEQQRYIFDPYTQASIQTTRNFGGTGLGLSIVQQLVSLHHSSIHIKSELNAGAEFYFNITYPLANNTVEIRLVPDSVKPLVEVSRLRILLAEDNMMSVLFMKKLFSNWGIMLDVAVNGLEVIALMETKDYDLILMDLQMPEMDGFEAAVKIRRMDDVVKANIHIIALTASVSDEVNIKVTEVGMNDCLSKPFNPDRLYEKLQYLPLDQGNQEGQQLIS